MNTFLKDSKEFLTNELLVSLLNSLPDMIHSVDKEGKILFTNDRSSEILGYTKEELLKLTIFDLYAPEVRYKVKRGFKTLIEKGDMKVRESLLRTKAGDLIPVEIRSFGVYDEKGEFIRTFSMLRDIRELKEMRDNLMHAERLTGIGQLASCVVHDIHNPLMVIQLYTEMLVQDAERYLKKESENEVKDYLVQMQKATGKIQRLLQYLRNFSRRQTDEKQEIDLNSLIDDALFMVMNKIISHKVKVERRNEGEKYTFSGSIIELEQVVMNLISNACDSMRESNIRTLTISMGQQNLDGTNYYCCSIGDTGCGIKKENLENIFTAFYTTKKLGEGTGLGLAICNEIVQKHEGKIELESEEGQGTTFKILIPCD